MKRDKVHIAQDRKKEREEQRKMDHIKRLRDDKIRKYSWEWIYRKSPQDL